MTIDGYIQALAITLIIEVVVTFIVLGLNLRYGLLSLAINLISHPWAYILYKDLNVDFYVVELLVFVFELLLWRILTNKSWKIGIHISFFTNISSILFGPFLSRVMAGFK